MEMIDGKPHVVHQVGEKETLYGLSRRYGSTVADILARNPTADAGLEVGQILMIPYVGKPKAPDAVKTAQGVIHRVGAKETLFSIARHYNVSVDDIRSWNSLSTDHLSIGQEILVKQKSGEPVTEVKPAATPTSAGTHSVASKETLYSIARQYGMTVAQLKEWNGLTADEVKIGQVLTVATASPGTMTPAYAPASTPSTSPSTGTTAPVVAPLVVTPASSGPVRVSEGLSGANEWKESGVASLLQGTEANRKYLAQHATIKPGTIIKIRHLVTNQEVFVRVIGPPTTPDSTVMIFVSGSAFDRLGGTDSSFRAELTYYK